MIQAAMSQDGILRVKVVDENRLNMPGATLSITGAPQRAATDVMGNAILYAVKTGIRKLQVSYIGYVTVETDINVVAGPQDIVVTMKPGASQLRGVVVMGDRLKGQARALNQQKNAGNISNIVSADQIGRFPDQNIGEALRRVPGIAMQNDQGEARDIIIRGIAPQLNSVTLNGNRIPSAEGDNRRIQMDLIPADMVQTLEVSKTLTPDMDGDAIGGSVNLVTRPAPNKFRVSAMLSGGKNQIREGGILNMSLMTGGRLFNGKLGIMSALTVNDNDYGSDNIEAVWSRRTDGPVFLSEHDIRIYNVRRTRRSANLTLDYKIDKRNTITVSGMYNWRDDWENRFRLRTTGITPQFTSGTFTGYRGEVRAQTKGGIDSRRIRNARLEEQIVQTGTVKGEHLIGKKSLLEWSSNLSRASEYRPNERYWEYNRSGITGLVMDIADPELPLVRPTTLLGAADLNFRRLTEQMGNVYENDWTTKASLRIPIDRKGKHNDKLRIGVRFSDRSKRRENDFYRYTPTTAGLAQLRTMNLVGYNSQNVTDFQPGAKFVAGPFVTPSFLGTISVNSPTSFTPSRRFEEFLALNYEAKERITAGYIRYDHEFNDRLSVISGVRMEATAVDYTGNNVLNTTVLKGTTSLKNAYVNVLPGINFRYEAKKDLLLRAGITTAIARPGYYELTPYRNVVSADNQITLGNPDLKPTYSTNLDLMAEKYFKTVGILSGGVFYKRLNDFIFTYSDPTYDSLDYQSEFAPLPGENPIPKGSNWVYRTSRNGSTVDVFGFEVAFQRQLDFLPGFLKGLGIYLNYTYTQSSADGVFTPTGVKRTGISLPGTTPHMFNGSLSYEDKKVVIRVSANYAAGYLDEIGSEAFFDRYYDSQFFLDVNASYAFTPRFRIFTELTNLTNQPLRYYQGERSRTAQLEYYRSRGVLGLKVDLF
jgi:TonB-dependent receptor